MTDSTKPGKQGTHEGEVHLRLCGSRTRQSGAMPGWARVVKRPFVTAGILFVAFDNCLGQLDAPGFADLSPNPALATLQTTLGTVSFGNGVFVAAGSRQTILSSDDGENWARRSKYGSIGLRGIAFGSGRFVAVGCTGTILTSPDGVDWIQETAAAAGHLWGVTHGNGM